MQDSGVDERRQMQAGTYNERDLDEGELAGSSVLESFDFDPWQ